MWGMPSNRVNPTGPDGFSGHQTATSTGAAHPNDGRRIGAAARPTPKPARTEMRGKRQPSPPRDIAQAVEERQVIVQHANSPGSAVPNESAKPTTPMRSPSARACRAMPRPQAIAAAARTRPANPGKSAVRPSKSCVAPPRVSAAGRRSRGSRATRRCIASRRRPSAPDAARDRTVRRGAERARAQSRPLIRGGERQPHPRRVPSPRFRANDRAARRRSCEHQQVVAAKRLQHEQPAECCGHAPVWLVEEPDRRHTARPGKTPRAAPAGAQSALTGAR